MNTLDEVLLGLPSYTKLLSFLEKISDTGFQDSQLRAANDYLIKKVGEALASKFALNLPGDNHEVLDLIKEHDIDSYNDLLSLEEPLSKGLVFYSLKVNHLFNKINIIDESATPLKLGSDYEKVPGFFKQLNNIEGIMNAYKIHQEELDIYSLNFMAEVLYQKVTADVDVLGNFSIDPVSKIKNSVLRFEKYKNQLALSGVLDNISELITIYSNAKKEGKSVVTSFYFNKS
jgi:hypothetical protein